MTKSIIFIATLLCIETAYAAIERVTLVDSTEIRLFPEDITHLPGIGRGIRCDSDSLILLDSPSLESIRWVKPNSARDLVVCRNALYAAEGDSIYRVATDSLPQNFVARLDNEQFRLYQASDSALYACTAEENFSCVYLIDPVERTCRPELSVNAPIMKISAYSDHTMVWIDDQILIMNPDGSLSPVYSSPVITDMAMTPVGLVVATTEGIYWVTGPGMGGKIIEGPVSGAWWDDEDYLYYLTGDGTLVSVYGFLGRYLELAKGN